MRKSPSSGPPDGDPDGDPVTRIEVNQTHEEILEYWTEQRMAEAEPRELRLPGKDPRIKQGEADADPEA